MSIKSKKGFTLIELIIVIAILGIIALIAVPNLAGIRQRAQVSADKRTAEQIGKAVRIWATDVDTSTAHTLPAITATGVKYTTLSDIQSYISTGYTAKSLGSTAGDYWVATYDTAAGTNGSTQKIAVYIGTSGPTAACNTTKPTIGYVGGAAGWAYAEQ